MRHAQTDNDVSPDDLSLAVDERLVAYEEAKAAGNGLAPDTSSSSDLCEHLTSDLACVDLLHRVWPDFDPLPPTPDKAPPPKILGDFRVIREIGRGGMGTVFEAEQISMGRRVALKVLPFAALVQEKSLQRFRNEVRAAASLAHPNIVAVYSIGEERGVHFYAMQLIRGQTLAEMVSQLRKAMQGDSISHAGNDAPTIDSAARPAVSTEPVARISTAANSRHSAEFYRSAARLGIQAAEALQHAHDLGVLHRDIKPSNLMVDAVSQLYITDFGLARIEADAGLTMTGDIIGTLRYMAPEQALAKRVVIDHRADVYSLGATLYELLTLQPAFAETDRSELLKQIAFEEPRPLRKLDRYIPAELETIVLKAMEKNPDERYQTAGRLADDLRAFLEDKPITAKRPSLVHRARKWGRRHRAFVGASAAACLFSIIISAGSVGWVVRDWAAQQATAEANAEVALKDAENFIEKESWNEALAAIARAEDDLSRSTGESELSKRAAHFRKDAEMFQSLKSLNGNREMAEQAAILGQWSKSADYFDIFINDVLGRTQAAIELDYLKYVTVLLRRGDRQSYDSFRQMVVKKFKDTDGPTTAERMLRLSLLVPWQEQTPDVFENWHTVLLKAHRQRFWDCAALGLLEYRRGHWQDSADWCSRGLELSLHDTACGTMLKSLLAMCNEELHRPDDAMRELETARQSADDARVLGRWISAREWFDWEFAAILLDEAEALIESKRDEVDPPKGTASTKVTNGAPIMGDN